MARRKHAPSVEANPLFDPAKLAEDAIRANLDPAVFDLIDESDIIWPRNWFEWVHGSRFLNVNPFAKQVEICVNLYGQFCPRCSDRSLTTVDEHWGNRLLLLPTDMSVGDIRDRVTFLEHGRCPQCNVTKPELIGANDLAHYVNLAGVAGMRASKSVTVGGLIGTYQLVRYLSLPSPSKYFGLMANQMLHGTFTAVTATQCYDTLWQAFKDRVENSPWFQRYHEFLTAEATRIGKETLYDAKDSFLWYGHKQLSFSYCGPDIRTIRGRTRIMAGIDEAGWFDVKSDSGGVGSASVRLNAKETHEALIKSLRTIRSAAMKLRQQAVLDPADGLNADVSSPSSMNDFIMRSLRGASQDRSVATFHYSTWEMNPNVPLESLRDEMTDPAAFERDYAAVPPLGANQFISSQSAVEKCEGPAPQTRLVTWDKKQFVDDFGDVTAYLDVKPIRDKAKPRMIAVDTGLTNNSFAVTVMSYDRDNRMPVVDIALECMPERHGDASVSVNFPLMYEHVLERLLQNLWICLVVYDRWNCATGDSYVYTADGGMKRLDEMNAGSGVVNHVEGVAERNGVAETSRWGCLPERATMMVTTVGGYRFSGTPEHRLLAEVDGSAGWKCLDELGTDDWVAFRAPGLWPVRYVEVAFEPRPDSVTCELCGQKFGNLQRHVRSAHSMPLSQYRDRFAPCYTMGKTGKPVPRFPDRVDEKLGALLGYLTAEGWGTVEFSNANRTVIDNYCDLYSDCFAILPGRQDGVSRTGTPYWRILTSSVDVRRYIEALMPSRLSGQKDVPPAIRQSPRSVVVAYLAALFEGDGSATVTERHTAYVTLASKSRRLLETVQSMLVNFDIFSTVSCKPQHGVYQLSVTGSYATRFLSEIGFVTKGVCGARVVEEKETLPTRTILRRWAAGSPDTSGLRPHTAHWLRYRAGNISTGFYRELRPWLLERYPEVAAQIDALAQFRWRRVKSIAHRGVESVYDLTVPDSSSFIANGFVSHNSIDAVQRIRKDHKVEAVQYSLKWADFQVIRARVLDSSIRFPKLEIPIEQVRKDDRPFEQIVSNNPVTHLALQTLTVREGGRKVIKPLNGTDDLFRCLCLGLTFILDPKYTSRFERYGGALAMGASVPGVVRLCRSGPNVGRGRQPAMTGVGVRKPFTTGRLT